MDETTLARHRSCPYRNPSILTDTGKGTTMGAWGPLTFDNDTACDWSYDLENTDDLSLVESAFADVESTGPDDFLEQDQACNALAACEVLARLRGHPGYTNAYTAAVDRWVAAHKLPPSSDLLTRATAVIDRILADNSELRDLWSESDPTEWQDAVQDLRRRLTA
jgi:hypothetical protein